MKHDKDGCFLGLLGGLDERTAAVIRAPEAKALFKSGGGAVRTAIAEIEVVGRFNYGCHSLIGSGVA